MQRKQDRAGKGAEQECGFMRNITSVRSPGGLWSMIDITRLSYLEFKGIDLLSCPPIFNCWLWSTLMSVRSRDMGKTPTISNTPFMQLALTSLSQDLLLGKLNPKTLTAGKSLTAPNSSRSIISLRTKFYNYLEG